MSVTVMQRGRRAVLQKLNKHEQHQGCAGGTDWDAGPTLTWMLGWRVCQIQEGQGGLHLGRGTVVRGALESAQMVFLDLDRSYSCV